METERILRLPGAKAVGYDKNSVRERQMQSCVPRFLLFISVFFFAGGEEIYAIEYHRILAFDDLFERRTSSLDKQGRQGDDQADFEVDCQRPDPRGRVGRVKGGNTLGVRGRERLDTRVPLEYSPV